jgi:hypothetical protein
MADLTISPQVTTLAITPAVTDLTIESGTTFVGLAGLLYAESWATTDRVLTGLNAWYDLASISLSTGVWFVSATATGYSASAAPNVTMRIVNSATVTQASTEGTVSKGGAAVSVSCAAFVTVLAASEIIKMQGAGSIGAAATVKYLTPNQAQTNATGLVAIRVA